MSTTNWKDQLKRMKLDHIKESAPGFYELSGGERLKLKPWNDSTANGLTRAIIDFINFNQGSATRISCTGQVRKVNGQMKWLPGTTRRGTADIHAIVRGRHLSIEVKIGRDKMSEYQHKEKSKIEAAGGLYVVATDMDSFIQWYDSIFNNNPIK